MQTIFITGGAGYLGTNISLVALEKGYTVVILDNFKNSYCQHINRLKKDYPNSLFVYKGDVRDNSILDKIHSRHHIDSIIHLAAYKYVGESISNSNKYYENNMESLDSILDFASRANTKKFAFASSAVVYGNPISYPTNETENLSPLSPYAETKAEGERIIEDWCSKTHIPSIIYRFSNPIGAESTYGFGDDSKKKVSNLLPYIIDSIYNDEHMTFKGNDHPTHDGTAVRDYIFVCDLAKAVIGVLEKYNEQSCEIVNVSRGKGFSVLDLLRAAEKGLNKKAQYDFAPRNEKEASISLLSADKLHSKYDTYLDTDIDKIVESEIIFRKSLQKER